MTPFAPEASRCRSAHLNWADRPIRERLATVREFRHLLVDHADTLAEAVHADVGRRPGEVVATDLLPTAAAAKFLLTDAERILRPTKPGRRPLWLWDCRDTIHRRPHGLVGLIGTWNYPVFLNAVPHLQAIVAGNGVLWKPSELTPRTAETIHDLLTRAGVPADLVTMLPATRDAGPRLADADVDFVHFTGSDAVGRQLAARLGERLVPSVLELSGVDAVFVLPDADAEHGRPGGLVWGHPEQRANVPGSSPSVRPPRPICRVCRDPPPPGRGDRPGDRPNGGPSRTVHTPR